MVKNLINFYKKSFIINILKIFMYNNITMKKVSSLKSLKKRKGCFLVKRGKKTYVLSDKGKFKACQ